MTYRSLENYFLLIFIVIYESNECHKDGYGTMVPVEDLASTPTPVNPAPYVEPGVFVRFELQPMTSSTGAFDPDTCQAQVASFMKMKDK